MKKQIIIILVIFLCIITIIVANIFQIQKQQEIAKQENKEYEKFLNKTIYGTDIATIINKAIDENTINNISKDKNGKFIPNDTNSIIIEIEFITDEEKQETTIYNMEKIKNAGITNFIKNFSLTTFKSDKVEYHNKTGKISKITFKQLESISY